MSSTRREVIENKLLAALDDEGTVAILANEQMLNDLIRGLWNYEGDIKLRARLESIRDDLTQLRDAAFPLNVQTEGPPTETSTEANQ